MTPQDETGKIGSAGPPWPKSRFAEPQNTQTTPKAPPARVRPAQPWSRASPVSTDLFCVVCVFCGSARSALLFRHRGPFAQDRSHMTPAVERCSAHILRLPRVWVRGTSPRMTDASGGGGDALRDAGRKPLSGTSDSPFRSFREKLNETRTTCASVFDPNKGTGAMFPYVPVAVWARSGFPPSRE